MPEPPGVKGGAGEATEAQECARPGRLVRVGRAQASSLKAELRVGDLMVLQVFKRWP